MMSDINNTNGKQNNITISIIIPVYNVQKYLERCLESVSNQDYQDFEALLIDDGSCDQSGQICDRWAKGDDRFKVYHKINGGLSDARNYGLDRCVGEYICFVDSDDYLESTYLSYLYALITKSPGCKVSQANHNIIVGKKIIKNYNGNHDFVFSAHEVAESVLFHDRIDVSAWGKMYDRSIFDNLRFPKGKLFEDTYIFSDILIRAGKYSYGHIPQYNYVKRSDSLVNQCFTDRKLEYIEAAEKMTSQILSQYPDLRIGCIRRINHSRLSVLRYMNNCTNKYKGLRKKLRLEILKDSNYYIHDSRTPKRDRTAVLLLKLGLKPFYFGWGIYTFCRNR